MALEPAKLHDFRLNQPIGAGSTAKVFDAVHLASGKSVAIKMLGHEASKHSELRERLTREAHILASVESSYVGQIYGLGYDGDRPFLVLERLYGETLDALIKREGQLTTSQIVHWIEQLLIGVRDCHSRGIVHRDVKPSNVFLQEEAGGGRAVKLIDFGVARLRELTQSEGSLTRTNHLIGSVGYMAPEQFYDPRRVGPQADLYAVGALVFRVISGRLPHMHRSLEMVARMKAETDAPRLSSMPNVVSIGALDAFCERALARDLAQRFADAREMLDEWWNVVAHIDADAPLTVDVDEPDVVFEEDELMGTLIEPDGSFPFENLDTSDEAPSSSSVRQLGDTDRPSAGGSPSEAPGVRKYPSESPTKPGDRNIKHIVEQEKTRQMLRKGPI